MKYQVVLWDFDGTLVDSSPGLFRSLGRMFERMGRPVPGEEVLRKFIGPPIVYSLKTYTGMSDEDAEKAVWLFRENYEAGGCYLSKVYDGLPELLGRLRERGIKTGVATLKPEKTARHLLEYLGIDHLIDTCIGNRNDEKGAITKKDIIETALDRLGWTDKSRVVLIGDSVYDADGAITAGIDFVGAAYGFGLLPEQAEELGCCYVAESPADLEPFFFGPGDCNAAAGAVK